MEIGWVMIKKRFRLINQCLVILKLYLLFNSVFNIN